MVTHPVPTIMEITSVRATLDIQATERTVQILMSVQEKHTTATPMPAVRILKAHSSVVVT
jgi:hypothetical protein